MIGLSTLFTMDLCPGSVPAVHMRLCGWNFMQRTVHTACRTSDDKGATPYCSRTCLMRSRAHAIMTSEVEHSPQWHFVLSVTSQIRELHCATRCNSSELVPGPQRSMASEKMRQSTSLFPLAVLRAPHRRKCVRAVVPDSSFSPVLSWPGQAVPLLTGGDLGWKITL